MTYVYTVCGGGGGGVYTSTHVHTVRPIYVLYRVCSCKPIHCFSVFSTQDVSSKVADVVIPTHIPYIRNEQ